MKILLLGAGGQLGQELSFTLPGLDEINEVKACTRQDLDVTDFTAVINLMKEYVPDVIVNASAYTQVDKAENEPEKAYLINEEVVSVLAQGAKQLGALLIHYSTDYVFDGSKVGRYTELDLPNPLNVYGHSKLAGEQKIIQSGCDYLIFRTTWVVGVYGDNFVKSILKLAQGRETLSVVNDQVGVPTTTGLVSRVTKCAIREKGRGGRWTSGIYHLAPRGQTTWFHMAKIIVDQAQKRGLDLTLGVDSIHPIKTVDYFTPAKRALNSMLNTEKVTGLLDFELPEWKDELISVVDKILDDITVGGVTHEK